MPPEPRPWITRPKMRISPCWAHPQIADPMPKTKTATIMGYFRPHKSATCPYNGSNIVLARRNAVATQLNFVPRFKSLEIVGRAVLVIDPSRAESNRGTQVTNMDPQNPSSGSHFRGVSFGTVSVDGIGTGLMALIGAASGLVDVMSLIGVWHFINGGPQA